MELTMFINLWRKPFFFNASLKDRWFMFVSSYTLNPQIFF
jgi:hypothetical protein